MKIRQKFLGDKIVILIKINNKKLQKIQKIAY